VLDGKDVEVIASVDSSLIAGAVTKIGSVVYDGSLANQLGRLRQQLISE
jgi:F0F1-type ATP synthase delta subunit